MTGVSCCKTILVLHLVLAIHPHPALSRTPNVRWKQRLASTVETHPRQVSVYVADIPSQYQTSPSEYLWGFKALGQATDIEHNLWDPVWSNVNKWWINQMNISPLRTRYPDEADVIFVPATISYEHPNRMEEFLANATDMFPQLTSKPHVLTLEHPPFTWRMYNKEVFEKHKEVLKRFILVSIEGYVRDWDWINEFSITTPYFGAVHWHRGMVQRNPDIDAIIASKSQQVLLSAKIRHYEVRYRLFQDCIALKEACTFIDWNDTVFSSSQLAAQTFSNMINTWYTLMPRGDFVTRNSFYEALCAGSIPVVMERDYFRHCAFHDIIDYGNFVQILPEEVFMGNISQNVVESVVVRHDDVKAARMLSGLWQVNNVFQYSLNPSHELIRFDKMGQIVRNEDAFTFTWKAILRHICTNNAPPEKCSATSAGNA